MIAAARPFLEHLGAEYNSRPRSRTMFRRSRRGLADTRSLFSCNSPVEVPPAQQGAFQRLSERGGGWVGIHAAG